MRIGIAGLIGSGKSAVARMVAQEGYPVVFADDEAHVLYRENMQVRASVAQAFGEHFLTAEGVDRARLGRLVFQDPQALQVLENMIHPALALHLFQKLAQESGLVFLEGALLPRWPTLLESLDQVWNVEAAAELRLQRIVSRGLAVEEAQKRMVQQEKFPALHHPHVVTLRNEGSLQDLQAKVQAQLQLVLVGSQGM